VTFTVYPYTRTRTFDRFTRFFTAPFGGSGPTHTHTHTLHLRLRTRIRPTYTPFTLPGLVVRLTHLLRCIPDVSGFYPAPPPSSRFCPGLIYRFRLWLDLPAGWTYYDIAVAVAFILTPVPFPFTGCGLTLRRVGRRLRSCCWLYLVTLRILYHVTPFTAGGCGLRILPFARDPYALWTMPLCLMCRLFTCCRAFAIVCTRSALLTRVTHTLHGSARLRTLRLPVCPAFAYYTLLPYGV